jgi:hypothetical protein
MPTAPYIISKIKLWDGTEEVSVNSSNQLEVAIAGGISSNILSTKNLEYGISSQIVKINNYLYWISANVSSMRMSINKMDNQENSITYSSAVLANTDKTLVAAPGAGYKLRIHHIYAVNEDTTDHEFNVRNGSAGVPYFPFYLAAYGGAVAQNLKRPWDLTANTALYYDYVAGTTADSFLTFGYEVISSNTNNS